MSTREEAIALLSQFRECRARKFWGEVDDAQRGIGFALAYLVNSSGEVIAGDLAKNMGVSTARIAALLNKMEKSGLVKRNGSAKDARKTVVCITPEGREIANGIREKVIAKVELLLDRVGKEDLEEFLRISLKIKTALEE